MTRALTSRREAEKRKLKLLFNFVNQMTSSYFRLLRDRRVYTARRACASSSEFSALANLHPPTYLWSVLGLETESQIVTGDQSGATDGRFSFQMYGQRYLGYRSRACEQPMRTIADYSLTWSVRVYKGHPCSIDYIFSLNVT